MSDRHNIIPVTMALLLHVVIFGSMIVAFDYARPPLSVGVVTRTDTAAGEFDLLIYDEFPLPDKVESVRVFKLEE